MIWGLFLELLMTSVGALVLGLILLQQSTMFAAVLTIPLSVFCMTAGQHERVSAGLFLYVVILVFIGGLLLLLVIVSSTTFHEHSGAYMAYAFYGPIFLGLVFWRELTGAYNAIAHPKIKPDGTHALSWLCEEPSMLWIGLIVISSLIVLTLLILIYKGLMRGE